MIFIETRKRRLISFCSAYNPLLLEVKLIFSFPIYSHRSECEGREIERYYWIRIREWRWGQKRGSERRRIGSDLAHFNVMKVLEARFRYFSVHGSYEFSYPYRETIARKALLISTALLLLRPVRKRAKCRCHVKPSLVKDLGPPLLTLNYR